MSGKFQKGTGNWVEYRSALGLSKTDEIDLHFGSRHQNGGDDRPGTYDDNMAEIMVIVENSLRKAQRDGRSHVMFIHGWSTSGPGRTTARSQVRSFMRSRAATPFIERAHCIQHDTVFIAKIKQHKRCTKLAEAGAAAEG
jgi:hypothetical protein